MKRSVYFKSLSRLVALLLTLIMMGGCSPRLYEQPTYDSDDMYGVHSAEMMLKRQEAKALAAAQMRTSRLEQWAQRLGYTSAQSAMVAETTIVDTKSYQTPYGEKLLAMYADSYTPPSSYYELSYSEQSALNELAAYDPAKYNAYFDELGNIVVEPKYISSIYGNWAMPYSAAWLYGYPAYLAPAWGYYPSYNFSAWGYYSYGYSPYYDPWWGVYPYYGRPHYGAYRPTQRKATIVKRADPYSSPSSGRVTQTNVSSGARRSDGSTVGTSTGSTYNRGGSTSTSSGSTSTRSTATPTTTTTTPKLNSIGR